MAGVVSWGELRCSECIQAGRYSRILLKFTIGAMLPTGQIAVQCRCGHIERLTAMNHYGDGVRTFRSQLEHASSSGVQIQHVM